MCGALTGAYMVIGLKHGKLHSDGTKYGVNTETTYRLVAEIAARFTERNGSTHCRDLIEHDLSDPDQRAEVVRLGYFKTRRGKYIYDSVDLPDEWYLTTGNGFPSACYTVFKVIWYKKHEPVLWKRVHKILGTKDYINFKLTGKLLTDYSYASGTGIYDLKGWKYCHEFITASGIPADVWPEIVPSTHVIGKVRSEIAEEMGLSNDVLVVCGGVDNSCMALGAKNIKEGRVYTSLGSSAWIAVSSEKPVLDKQYKPYVFAHVMPNMFTSAVSIFADVFNTRILKTNIDQDAAALGAAAIAAVGCGLWSNFEKINAIHKAVEMVEPDVDNNRKYEKLLPVFVQSAEYQAQISDSLREIEL